jgi:hypothetical protein
MKRRVIKESMEMVKAERAVDPKRWKKLRWRLAKLGIKVGC